MTAFSLEGAGVLVTGGGTGIGRACAARHHLRAGPDFRSFTGLSPDQMLGRRPPPG